MLDLGWTEILIIMVLGLLVIGPKELPKLVRTVGKWRGKMSAYARDFQRSIEDVADVTEVDAIKKEIAEANRELNEANRDMNMKEQTADNNEDMQRAAKDSTFSGPNLDSSVTEAGAPASANKSNGEVEQKATSDQGANNPAVESSGIKPGESRENSANV